MEISSKSWHLRLVRRLCSDYVPKSLCSYFWTVNGALFCTIFLGLTSPIWWPLSKVNWIDGLPYRIINFILISFILGLFGFVTIQAVLHWSIVIEWLKMFWWILLLGVGVLTLIMVLLVTISLALLAAVNNFAKPKLSKDPNLFIEWVKAKKGRFCPLITVRNDNA